MHDNHHNSYCNCIHQTLCSLVEGRLIFASRLPAKMVMCDCILCVVKVVMKIKFIA